MLRITVRFPLGVYHAQSASDFATAEWPPHPVRLIAALKAAAHGAAGDDLDAALGVVGALAVAEPPLIVAPRAGDLDGSDGEQYVARLRGASRWAPRNHELAELRGGKGVSPRDLGRSRAEVQKVGVAIGEHPVSFEWPDLSLDDAQLAVLTILAEDMTVLGTARSPAIVRIDALGPLSDPLNVWAPTDATGPVGVAQVRVPTARTPDALDQWHAQRSSPLRRDGSVDRAAYVPPFALGEEIGYLHGVDASAVEPGAHDPRWWGDMLVVVVDRERGDDRPKSAASFAFARALRKALLDQFEATGTPGEAPPVLIGRGDHPHAAFVPLSFVAEPPSVPAPPPARSRRTDAAPPRARGAGAAYADGRTLGVAVVLPHPARLPGVARQRRDVELGLGRLLGLDGAAPTAIQVPGVGPVWLTVLGGHDVPATLREARYRVASARWSTATPLVHSRYLPRKGEQALYEQVARECSDVGLPAPVRVAIRRGPRFRGSARSIDARRLPESWVGPLHGPQVHLDLWFEQPVLGPVLLGRARHFGLGLCLPFADDTRA